MLPVAGMLQGGGQGQCPMHRHACNRRSAHNFGALRRRPLPVDKSVEGLWTEACSSKR